MEGVESATRTRTVAENLEIWGEMEKGSEIGLKNCMRIKMDMQVMTTDGFNSLDYSALHWHWI